VAHVGYLIATNKERRSLDFVTANAFSTISLSLFIMSKLLYRLLIFYFWQRF